MVNDKLVSTSEEAKDILKNVLFTWYISNDDEEVLVEDIAEVIVNGHKFSTFVNALKSVGRDAKHNEALTTDVRNNIVESITEKFYEAHGQFPSNKELFALTDFILYHSLEGDTRPDKMQAEEYPLLSDTQRDRRIGKRGVRGNYEVSEVWYEGVGKGQALHF